MVWISGLLGLLCASGLAACTNRGAEAGGSGAEAACDASRFLGVGFAHACALLSTGEVACWGAAGGNGTLENHTTPVLVPGVTNAIAVTAGRSHSCALLASREVLCWGRNAAGQLGEGTTTDQLVPVRVSNLSGVQGVSAGSEHTCALLGSGSVACWGANERGQAGVATGDVQLLPRVVTGVANVREISAGGSNTCALLASGKISCWGWYWENDVGSWSAAAGVLPAVSNAVDVSAGQNHDCVLLKSGEAACRGYNRQGQLGDGGDATRSEPALVLDLADATSITAGVGGYGHTCALRETGEVVCWGINTNAQLGNSNTESVQRSPGEPVLSLDDAIAVEAGEEHACALRRSGEVFCWGKGDVGQLGNGPALDQRAATVSGLLAATCP